MPALICLAILLAFLLWPGCTPGKAPQDRQIAATIHPLGALTAEIAGPEWKVLVLLPPGASPHAFEPTPRLVAKASRASLVLRVGAGLDDWARPLVREAVKNGAPEIVLAELTDSLLPAIHHHDEKGEEAEATGRDEGTDPHIWLDPLAMIRFCEETGRRCEQIDPEHAGEVRLRTAAVEESLRALDRQLRAAFAPVKDRPFLATHNAWGYLCRRYGLIELDVLQEVPTREPGPKRLSSLVDEAAAHRAAAVFTEIQNSSASARTLAGELGLPVMQLDPQGTPDDPARDRYFDLMRWNARRIVEALSEGPGPASPAASALPTMPPATSGTRP